MVIQKRFLFRLRVTTGIALVVLGLYAIDALTASPDDAARGAWDFLVKFSIFWGWFGLEEIWYAGRKLQAGVLGAILFFSGLVCFMIHPSPGWSQVLNIAISTYAVATAWRILKGASVSQAER